MKEKLKKYFGPIYITAASAAVIIWLACNREFDEIIAALGTLDRRWVFAAGGCVAMYLALRVAALQYHLRANGARLSLRQAMAVTGTGQFYSAVTPSASGGQPMQVYRMRQYGVPVSLGTSCISVKFIGFQASYLLLGLILALGHLDLINRELYGWRWLIALGYVLNSLLIAAVLLTVPRTHLADRLMRCAVRLGTKLKLIRNPEHALSKLHDTVYEYRQALVQMLRRPKDAAILFALSMAQTICYMMVAVCMARAFRSDAVWHDVLTLQLQLFVAAAFIPLPGAAGAQESGFCFFFRSVFPADQLSAAMLIWRFFSYYLLLLSGLVMMALGINRRGGAGD